MATNSHSDEKSSLSNALKNADSSVVSSASKSWRKIAQQSPRSRAFSPSTKQLKAMPLERLMATSTKFLSGTNKVAQRRIAAEFERRHLPQTAQSYIQAASHTRDSFRVGQEVQNRENSTNRQVQDSARGLRQQSVLTETSAPTVSPTGSFLTGAVVGAAAMDAGLDSHQKEVFSDVLDGKAELESDTSTGEISDASLDNDSFPPTESFEQVDFAATIDNDVIVPADAEDASAEASVATGYTEDQETLRGREQLSFNPNAPKSIARTTESALETQVEAPQIEL